MNERVHTSIIVIQKMLYDPVVRETLFLAVICQCD